MITVHELGHYIAGKIFKFKIKQFSIGFGPAIFKRTSKKSGEKFAIRIFPLGGFCEFESDDEAGNSGPQAFNNQKPWKRIIVLLAGAFANFIVSMLIVIFVFLIGGMAFPSVAKKYVQSPVDLEGNNIEYESKYYIKESERLQEGDIILEVGGVFQYLYGDFNTILANYEIGEEISITIIRDGVRKEIKTKKGYFVQPDYWRIESKEDIPLYESGNTSGEKLLMLKNKSIVEVIERGDDFWHIKISEKTGYVEAKYIKHIYPGTINSKAEVQLYDDISGKELIKLSPGQAVEIIEKGDDFWKVKITVEEKTYEGYVEKQNVADAYIGFGIGRGTATYRLPFFESLGRSFIYSFKMTWEILSVLGKLVTGQVSFNQIGGPVATVIETANFAKSGFRNFIDIVALIGINLAVMNLLPIPSLDGARIVFVLIEWIRKKPINRNIEAKIHMFGIIFLLAFVVVADVVYLIFKGG